MKHRLAALLAAACLLFTRQGMARELWEYEWVEVRSPNFVVMSGRGPSEGTALAQELEDLRFAAQIVTNVQRVDTRVPTWIYLLPRREEDVGFEHNAIGRMVATMRANYAVLVRDRGIGTDDVVKNGYVRFLLRSGGPVVYPTWMDEGFAELLATLDIVDGAIEFGKPNRGRIESLGQLDWIGFTKLLEVRSKEELSSMSAPVFVAQSWLLMHYLNLGREGADFPAQSARYMQLNDAGTAPVAAFEQAYGLRVASIEKTLRGYANRRMRYSRLKPEKPPAPIAFATAPLAPAEIAARIGMLSFLHGRTDAAQRALDAALALDGQNAVALALQGDLHKLAGRFEEAERHYARAIELEPGNALHQVDFAEYWLERAKAAGDPAARAELLARARRHFARGYAIDKELPELLAMNGATYLFPGEDVAKGVVSIEAAHGLLPASEQIMFMLASAYASAERPEEAVPLLRAIVARSSGKMADDARKLLDILAPAPPSAASAG